MPEDTNEIRAQHAYDALINYAGGLYPAETDLVMDEMVVMDFIADLMHYCRKAGLDFDDLSYKAWRHFEREVHEEEGATSCAN